MTKRHALPGTKREIGAWLKGLILGVAITLIVVGLIEGWWT